MADKSECVRVVVRCRPLNTKETTDGRAQIIEINPKLGSILARNPKGDSDDKPFTFDRVYDWNSKQIDIYNETARPIVESVLDGYNGTIFAYGQTGTGKTHTMAGRDDPPELRGITPNSFNHIFDRISISQSQQWLVRVSFLEIYNEEIRDLLAKNTKNKLEMRENQDGAVYVQDLTSFVVKSVAETQKVLDVGNKNRTTGATMMNQDSSRSHSVFAITIEQTAEGLDGTGNHIRVGKLNLVDLAGSERQAKTGATGDRLKEGIKINLSLTALGNVIAALTDPKTTHVPYRDSKLTRLLQDSLGGNTKTVMIANIGPADWNYDETMSTLRYANRAKNIKNKPRINEDPKDAMLREFQEEIERLKRQLDGLPEDGPVTYEDGGVQEVIEEREREITDAEKERMRREIEERLAQQMRDAGIELDAEALRRIQEEAARAAEEQMRKIEEDRRRAAEERAAAKRAVKEAKKEAADLKSQAEEEGRNKDELARRLAQMQSKLLSGDASGSTLIEATRRKEAELNRMAADLEARRAREMEEAERLRRMEEELLAKDESFSSRQEELENKTRKMKELLERCNRLQQEINDVDAENRAEVASLWETKRALLAELNMRQGIIDLFVPEEDEQKVLRRAIWDAEQETWTLGRVGAPREDDKQGGKRPMSANNSRRPTSAFAKAQIMQGDLNPRFKSDNILKLVLDMPERTTLDMEPQSLRDARMVDMMRSLFVETDGRKSLGGPSEVVQAMMTAQAPPPSSAALPRMSGGMNNRPSDGMGQTANLGATMRRPSMM